MVATADPDDMGRTSIQVSDELADKLHGMKDRGDSYEDVVWRLIEQAEGEDEEPSEPSFEPTETPSPTETPQREPEGEHQEDAEDILRSLDLAGSGSRYEARIDAVLAFYDHLRERPGELVSRGEFEDLVDERDIDVGYASFGSLWSNWVKSNEGQGRSKNTLAQLPGVEMDGDDYVYRG